LGTYGDGGNAVVLHRRLQWRGIPSQILPISTADPVPAGCDIYVLGGGEDGSQVLAAEILRGQRGLGRAADNGAVIFAVCAGLQILGEHFSGIDQRRHRGMELLDVRTVPRARRAVGEVVANPDPRWGIGRLTGFANHQGATTLGPVAAPLATVTRGVGNGAGTPDEGAVQGRSVGTYLHGPVLARNPDLADLLLTWAVGRKLAELPIPAVQTLRRNWL
jgi:hypothetical protein